MPHPPFVTMHHLPPIRLFGASRATNDPPGGGLEAYYGTQGVKTGRTPKFANTDFDERWACIQCLLELRAQGFAPRGAWGAAAINEGLILPRALACILRLYCCKGLASADCASSARALLVQSSSRYFSKALAARMKLARPTVVGWHTITNT